SARLVGERTTRMRREVGRSQGSRALARGWVVPAWGSLLVGRGDVGPRAPQHDVGRAAHARAVAQTHDRPGRAGSEDAGARAVLELGAHALLEFADLAVEGAHALLELEDARDRGKAHAVAR